MMYQYLVNLFEVKKVSIEVKQEDKAYVATVTYDADTTFKNKYTAPVVPTPEPF